MLGFILTSVAQARITACTAYFILKDADCLHLSLCLKRGDTLKAKALLTEQKLVSIDSCFQKRHSIVKIMENLNIILLY